MQQAHTAASTAAVAQRIAATRGARTRRARAGFVSRDTSAAAGAVSAAVRALLTTIMVTPARLSRAFAWPSSAALRTQGISRSMHMSRVVRAAPAPTSAEQTAQYPSEGT